MKLERCTTLGGIAYRGDTRPPEEIFLNGFWNRQTPEAQWLKILDGGSQDFIFEPDIESVETGHLRADQLQQLELPGVEKDCEPFRPGKLSYRMWLKKNPDIYVIFNLEQVDGINGVLWKNYITNLPVYREDKDDISPKTAVCFTLRPQVAPYFPIGGCQRQGGEWIWIYVAYLGAAYKTYRVQQDRGSSLAAAREVAVEHVSGRHVLCAVRCWRQGKYPQMDFLMSPRIWWNPRAGAERLQYRDSIAASLRTYQSTRTTCTACTVTGSARDTARIFEEPVYGGQRWLGYRESPA